MDHYVQSRLDRGDISGAVERMYESPNMGEDLVGLLEPQPTARQLIATERASEVVFEAPTLEDSTSYDGMGYDSSLD